MQLFTLSCAFHTIKGLLFIKLSTTPAQVARKKDCGSESTSSHKEI